MTDQWQELKDTIIEIRDNNEFEHGDVTLMCRFLVNYMEVLEKQMQEPSEDVVSKQAVIDIVDSYSESWSNIEDVTQDIISDIMALPPVNPQEPKTGHWIMPVQDDGMSEPIYYQVRCSECGFDLDPQTWHMELHQYGADKFCPNCGAKMIEPQESEDKE